MISLEELLRTYTGLCNCLGSNGCVFTPMERIGFQNFEWNVILHTVGRFVYIIIVL